MVAAGMGWSVVPQSFRRILPGDVAYVRIADKMPNSLIGLARRQGERSAAVRNFTACARRQAGRSTATKAC
jgi:DNA-binding transcriptional LysR family regulator